MYFIIISTTALGEFFVAEKINFLQKKEFLCIISLLSRFMNILKQINSKMLSFLKRGKEIYVCWLKSSDKRLKTWPAALSYKYLAHTVEFPPSSSSM